MICKKDWIDDINNINFKCDEIYDIIKSITILNKIKLDNLYEICGITVAQDIIDEHFISIAEWRDNQINSILE